MQTRLFRTIPLVAVLTVLGLLNSGCDLLSTILTAIGTCGGTSDITVTTTVDSNTGTCTATNCSLRNAVTRSNLCPGTQVIHIPSGSYVLTITGADEDNNRTGDLDITDIVQIMAGDHRTIDGSSTDRVLDIKPGVNVQVHGGLIIQHGMAQGDSSDLMAGGGGIRNQGTLVMDNCEIANNSSSAEALPHGSGGGILSSGYLELNSCSIVNNNAGQGGGIAALGFSVGVTSGSSLHMTNSSFTGNGAGNGGGLFLDSNTGTVLDNFMMDGNGAGSSHAAGDGYGGGIFNGAGELTLRQGQINNGNANRGGAIFNEGTLNSTQVTLQNNSALEGFAFFNEGGGSFSQGAIVNNHEVSPAYTNGALENCGGPFHVDNSTVSGNQGGGVNNPCGYAQLNLSFSTIANNTVYSLSAGVTGPSDTIIGNSIVAAVPGGISCLFYDPGVVSSHGHNLDSSGACNFHEAGDQVAEPGLLPLTMDSGTFVHPLAPGSPAIDTADGRPSCPDADQRGISRPQGGGCDRGAYEVPSSHALLIATPGTPTIEATKPGIIILPSLTPTSRPGTLQLTLVQNANCRRGPGTAYDVLTSVSKGQTIQLSGRNEDNTWWFTVLPGNNPCWVSMVAGQPDGDPGTLPLHAYVPSPEPTKEPNSCVQYKDLKACVAAGCNWNPNKQACN